MSKYEEEMKRDEHKFNVIQNSMAIIGMFHALIWIPLQGAQGLEDIAILMVNYLPFMGIYWIGSLVNRYWFYRKWGHWFR